MKHLMNTALLILITSYSFQTFADSAVVKVNAFRGQIKADEGLQIKKIKLLLALDFCAGWCSHSPTKTKELNSQVLIESNGQRAKFATSKNVSFRAQRFAESFRSCQVRMEATVTDANGETLLGHGILLLESNKDTCSDMTKMTERLDQELRKPVRIKRYNDKLSIFVER